MIAKHHQNYSILYKIFLPYDNIFLNRGLKIKKIKLIFGLFVMILSSCGNQTTNNDPTPETPEIVKTPDFVSYVAKKAAKYNGNILPATIMEKAGLNELSPCNEGNFIRTLKGAFDGFMPELKGQRKYGGVYTMPEITGSISNEANDALEWMVSYGLWNDVTIEKDEWGYDDFIEHPFDEEAIIDEDYMETYLKRFYMYFGTEENDDFFAYSNHDFLYEGNDDTTIDSSSNYRRSLMLDSETVKNNVLTYTAKLAESDDSSASLYKEALEYYKGTLDYSFLEDPLIKTQISFIKSIESLNGAIKYAENAFSLFGESILASIYEPVFMYDENMNVVTYNFVGSTTAPFQLGYSLYSREDVIEEGLKVYKTIGLSDLEADSYSSSLADFGLRCFKEYDDDKFDGKRGVHTALYDVDSNTDLFADNGINVDLTSIFTSSDYTLNDISSLSTSDFASYISFGTSLVNATPKELQAISLYELYSANMNAIEYVKGTAGSYKNLLTMIENNLADDYMKSDYYADSLANMTDIFTGIKRVFSERLSSSSWLSIADQSAIKEKIDAIKSTLIGTCSDGSTLDYKSLSTPSGLTLAATFGGANAIFQKGLIKQITNGQIFHRTLLLTDGPFLSNAFYTPNSNTINITFGAVFSLGLDRSKCTEECVLAKIGYILGHEVTHGFDSRGVYYDKTGANIKDGIIPQEDMDKFTKLTQKVEEIYRNQEVLTGLAQNPETTISEDVADIGGLTFMEEIGKDKPSFDFKLFYKEMASGFAAKITRNRFYKNNLYDVHPYGRVRCNVLLSNSELFQKTFEITEDDGMYLSKDKQVVIW